MTPSELADKLEYWRERVCDSQDIDNDKLSMSGFANIAFNNTREIIKCLRFAADMEKLVAAGEDPLFVRGHNCIWINGLNVAAQCDDIYSAARKAVEALEEKQ